MKILITGATGNLGGLTVELLLHRGVDPTTIVAGARTASRANKLLALGVEVRHLDYDDTFTIREALEGVDRVLLVSADDPGRRVEQHRNVVNAVSSVGVELLAYTSLTRADSSALGIAPDHAATEAIIAESELPAVILRNNWYTENYVRDVQRAARTGRNAPQAPARQDG